MRSGMSARQFSRTTAALGHNQSNAMQFVDHMQDDSLIGFSLDDARPILLGHRAEARRSK
jgi:hypothetical protein